MVFMPSLRAFEIIALAGPLRGSALLGLGHAQRARAGRETPRPRAGGIHEVALHVEDELAAVHGGARRLLVERRFPRQLEESAAFSFAGIGLVHADNRRRDAARRDQQGTRSVGSRFSGRARGHPVSARPTTRWT